MTLLFLSLSGLLVGQTDSLAVRVDSAKHEVVLSVHALASARPAGREHGAADHHSMSLYGWTGFDWPVDGWARGFRLSILACNQPLRSHNLLHHLVVANLARRQLVHPAMERLLAVGSETPDVVLPKTVGIPLRAGTPLAIRIAWAPPSRGCDLVFRLVILWTPKNLVPSPTSVLPFYVDVEQKNVLASNLFDLRPGQSTQSLDFALQVSGRLLAAGAHLHRYGQRISLIGLPRDTLSTLRARYEEEAGILRIDQKLYGVAGRGLSLKAGRPYRIVSEYVNPTDSTLHSAGMAHFVGLFAPDAEQPPLDREFSNPVLAEDYRRVCGSSYPACNRRESLSRRGRGSGKAVRR